jgi:hypothetical protein
MLRIKVLVAVLLVAGFCAAPAMAQQQTLSLNVGWFAVRSLPDRVPGDTLVADWESASPFALGPRTCVVAYRCDLSDFNNVTFGGDWLFSLGEFFEGGIGVNYYSKTVPTYYIQLQDQTSGGDITQDIRLRAVPVTASVRWLPLGRRFPVQPYLGVGVSVVPWTYSEVGTFAGELVGTTYPTYTADYHDSGVAVGPTIMAGVRVPFARAFSIGGEVRYLKADSALKSGVGFLGDRIDLGGVSYLATFNIKF